jgi:hypothetical protein
MAKALWEQAEDEITWAEAVHAAEAGDEWLKPAVEWKRDDARATLAAMREGRQ